jgi:hypothetical protein
MQGGGWGRVYRKGAKGAEGAKFLNEAKRRGGEFAERGAEFSLK